MPETPDDEPDLEGWHFYEESFLPIDPADIPPGMAEAIAAACDDAPEITRVFLARVVQRYGAKTVTQWSIGVVPPEPIVTASEGDGDPWGALDGLLDVLDEWDGWALGFVMASEEQERAAHSVEIYATPGARPLADPIDSDPSDMGVPTFAPVAPGDVPENLRDLVVAVCRHEPRIMRAWFARPDRSGPHGAVAFVPFRSENPSDDREVHLEVTKAILELSRGRLHPEVSVLSVSFEHEWADNGIQLYEGDDAPPVMPSMLVDGPEMTRRFFPVAPQDIPAQLVDAAAQAGRDIPEVAAAYLVDAEMTFPSTGQVTRSRMIGFALTVPFAVGEVGPDQPFITQAHDALMRWATAFAFANPGERTPWMDEAVVLYERPSGP